MNAPTLDVVTLHGLQAAPAQAWGVVRLVPLIRSAPRDDLRIAPRVYESLGLVDLGGRPQRPGPVYFGYVPYGLVVGWTSDGAEVAADTMLEKATGKKSGRWLTHHTRMVRREKRGAQSRLRLLPLHVAMEGFLSLCFGGPEIAWPELSQRVKRRGLSPRSERVEPGALVPDLAAALRVFEIHRGQCGVLVFVGGSLAAALVVSHPDDYLPLHQSLVEDFYGELTRWHGLYGAPASVGSIALDAERVGDYAGLRAELDRARAAWGDFEVGQAGGLFGRPVEAKAAYRMGPLTLQRFWTGMGGADDHIGEAIVRDDGTLEYLKTYRLSADQSRRGALLHGLKAHDWALERVAAARNTTVDGLRAELERAGLGYILAPR